MQTYTLTLDLKIQDGQKPTPEDLYTLLEANLDAASRDPNPLLDQMVHDPSLNWELAKNHQSGKFGDMYWRHIEHTQGDPVFAEIYSDDRIISGFIDIRSFLATSYSGDIEELAHDGWSFSESADQIAFHAENNGHPTAKALFEYLSLNPESVTGDQVGFSVSVDSESALNWLKEYRKDVFATGGFSGSGISGSSK